VTHGDHERIARNFQAKLTTVTGGLPGGHRRETYRTSVAARAARVPIYLCGGGCCAARSGYGRLRLVVPESKLETTEHGLVPMGDGWYVLNMRDAEWRQADGRGAVCVVADDFEGWRREHDQLGVNPFVLMPGEPMAMYHWEADQEAFLVVSGEAVLVVEGEERSLRPWDFVHCPPQTKHVIVGAGSGPCLVIAVGARANDGQPDSLGFPADEVAKRHGASVQKDTMDGSAAYASLPPREPTACREGWLPE
jgi:uncharacterized cupin superfamily protein